MPYPEEHHTEGRLDDAVTHAALVGVEPDGPTPDRCAFVIFSGSPNPDSANFGPDEQCEEDALPGEDYCDSHYWATADD